MKGRDSHTLGRERWPDGSVHCLCPPTQIESTPLEPRGASYGAVRNEGPGPVRFLPLGSAISLRGCLQYHVDLPAHPERSPDSKTQRGVQLRIQSTGEETRGEGGRRLVYAGAGGGPARSAGVEHRGRILSGRRGIPWCEGSHASISCEPSFAWRPIVSSWRTPLLARKY